MGCGRYRRSAMAQGNAGQGVGQGTDQPGGGWAGWGGCRSRAGTPSSGNRAFDEYRAETLRRLEDEQKEFAGFLDRLRFAKDKAEFDAFVEERARPPAPDAPLPGAPLPGAPVPEAPAG